MQVRMWFIGPVLGALLAPIPGWVLAAKPGSFTASGPVAVTSISDPIPAGSSDRVRIERETIASIGSMMSDSPKLDGKLLAFEQKSNELFSSADLPTAVALDGSSVGRFDVVDPDTGDIIASGKYHLNVTNVEGCQIFDQGHWSVTGSGNEFKGQGTVTACLNFEDSGPLPPTFVGEVTFNGFLKES